MSTDTQADVNEQSPNEPVHVNGQAELDDVVAENHVVLVDFHADWCGPCKMLDPIVTSIAAETEAAVAKVDVDANQALASKFGVRGVPTMVMFANGEAVEEIVGVKPEEQLRALVQQYAA
jgi:thioredoxin 1